MLSQELRKVEHSLNIERQRALLKQIENLANKNAKMWRFLSNLDKLLKISEICENPTAENKELQIQQLFAQLTNAVSENYQLEKITTVMNIFTETTDTNRWIKIRELYKLVFPDDDLNFLEQVIDKIESNP